MTNTFAGISEGHTDQSVIKNIIAGYFNPDIVVNWLQPLKDATSASRASNFGGWSQVFEYCESSKFREAFQFNEYVIIHIDTDRSVDFGVPDQDGDGKYSPEKMFDLVVEKFKTYIGEEFYQKYSEKIIFAIAVDSTECWLLPLYCSENNKKSKTNNCLFTLRAALSKANSEIDPDRKDPSDYDSLSKKYSKKKILLDLYKANPSLKIFIEEIEKRNIVIPADD
jgi:hypothetical protein